MAQQDRFAIAIVVNKEGSSYKASGDMTSGFVKQMIGELEVIKSRLIFDLEKSLNDEYTKKEK